MLVISLIGIASFYLLDPAVSTVLCRLCLIPLMRIWLMRISPRLKKSHEPRTCCLFESLLLPNMQRRSMIERPRHGIEDELKGGVKTVE